MELKSLTYTSLARLDVNAAELNDILQTARHLNALDGITGLLIFNGRHFLQIVEGSESAIDDLIERLRADRRHSALEVRDARIVQERAFGDWSMELVTVSTRYFDAHEEIGRALPLGVPTDIRDLVLRLARSVADPVEIPD